MYPPQYKNQTKQAKLNFERKKAEHRLKTHLIKAQQGGDAVSAPVSGKQNQI